MSRHAAFTLLELLIVLLMVGILIAISYPAYKHYIAQSKRHHANIALKQIASELEAYYALHDTYEGATNHINVQHWSKSLAYQITLTQLSHQGYQLQAIANSQQAKANPTCQTLTLNQVGKVSPAVCW